MMKVAAHTMGSPELTPIEAVDFFAAMGYDGIEFVCQEGYRCGPYVDWSRADRAKLKEYCAEKGMPVVCLTPYVTDLNSEDEGKAEEQMRLLRESILLAQALGAPVVRLYGGRIMPQEEWGRSIERAAARLRTLSDLCGESGVKIAVENHYGTITTTAAETMALVEAARSPYVGVLYDQCNLTQMHAEEYPDAIRMQADHIFHVHVKDIVFLSGRTESDVSGVTHIPQEKRAVRSEVIGRGVVPWMEVLKGLKGIGYDGHLSVEYSRKWYPEDLPVPEVGMKESADYLKDAVRSLG